MLTRRHALLGAMAAGLWACRREGTTDGVSTAARNRPRRPAPGASAKEKPPVTYDAVRVSPKTREVTMLGRVRFDGRPPFMAEVLKGGDDLKQLVAAMNAIDELYYSNGKPLPRSQDAFFDFMRRNWLNEQGVRLRVAARGTTVRRYQLLTVEAGQQVSLGTVEVNDRDYLRLVAGPSEHRQRANEILDEINAAETRGYDIAPPQDQPADVHGSYGRIVERGTREFFPLMLDDLAPERVVLVADDRVKLQAVDEVRRKTLVVHAPEGVRPVATSRPVIMELAGTGALDLGMRVSPYEDVAYNPSSVRKHIEQERRHHPGFVLQTVSTVKIAARDMLATTYWTTAGSAPTTHLVAFWAERSRDHDRVGFTDQGLAIELSLAGRHDVRAMLAHPVLAVLADTLHRR